MIGLKKGLIPALLFILQGIIKNLQKVNLRAAGAEILIKLAII